MSDLCMYEFVDLAWDEICQSDDHIVPHRGSKRLEDHLILADTHKKPRFGINTTVDFGDKSAAWYVDQRRDQGALSALSKERDTMLEKNSCPSTANGSFSSTSDCDTKEASSLVSDNNVQSTHGLKSNNTDLNSDEFSGNDTILDDKTTIVDNNSFTYPLGDMNNTSDDVNIFENAENKDSSDFLYYGWPDIGNFEDVDRMFRSCDSTFGLGVCKEDDMSWLSAADDLGGPDVRFSCPEPNVVRNISENHDSSKGYSINDSAVTSAPIRGKDSSWTSEKSDSYMSFVIEPSDRKDGLSHQEQGLGSNYKIQPRISTHNQSRTGSATMINEEKKQTRPQKQSERKSNKHYFENGAFSHINVLPNGAMQLHSGLTSHQAYPSLHVQQQQHAQYPDSYRYLQNPISYAPSDTSHLSEPDSINLEPSIVKSETKDMKSISPRDLSHAPNQLQFVKSSHDGGQSSLTSSLNNGSVVQAPQASIFNSGSVGKYENRNDPEGVGLATPSELGSSNVQESSTLSSGVQDISLEAASFRQLQLAMKQLDLRTKLCIRDSLYRLARSAKQRHNLANIDVGCGDERNATDGASLAEGTNNVTGFIDMETDTNPIDRSIAHLLFHRPSDSSTTPAQNLFAFKSPGGVNGSVASPPVLVENLVNDKAAVSEADKASDC